MDNIINGEKSFLLLGILSTIQLLAFGGISVFNLLLLMTIFIGVIYNKDCIKIDIFWCIYCALTIITVLISAVNMRLSQGFRHKAIIEGCVYILILVIYALMCSNYKYALLFLKGFKISCYATLIWSYLQLFVFKFINVDLNEFIFSGILKIQGAKGDYSGQQLIPSGFYSHRAILLPSMIFLFFTTSNIYIIFAIYIIALLSKSVALILGLAVATLFKMFIRRGRIGDNIVKIKVVRLLFIICLIGTAVFFEKDRILELGQYIIQRIADSTSNKYDNSSVVHYLYYRNFGTIIKNENIINFLFGTGFGTSGQHYTWFNNQYSNLSSWIVENDYINIFLNQGFFGFFAWIYFELRIIFVSKKVKNLENIGLIITALFIGLFYNIQFNWFILVEIAIYFLATENINFFADNKEETL